MLGKLILLGVVALTYGHPQINDAQLRCSEAGPSTLIPHETDCGKFYYCNPNPRSLSSNAIEPQLFACQEGTEFSVELQRCTDPAVAKCACNEPEPEQPAPPVVPESEEEREITYLPNGCPEQFDVHHLLPHETECYLFYYCERGEKVVSPCGRGTSFDFDEQTCVHDGACVHPEVEQPVPEANPEVADSIERHPNGCPVDYRIEQLFPHETRCDRFYQCTHGNYVEMPCAPGTQFSFELQRCEHAHIVGCVEPEPEECVCDDSEEECDEDNSGGGGGGSNENGGGSNENGGGSNENGGGSNENGGGSNENGGGSNENGGGSNENGGGSNENGGGSNENGGGSNENGGGSNECDCEEEEPEPPQPERNPCEEDCHVPYWRHETECDKFWRCVGQEKVLGTCSEGLQFNEDTHTCDFACNVDCIRSEVQSTAEHDGLKLFIPWSKVNDLVYLSKVHKDIARAKSHK